ncbi:YafY family protein [Microbacterium sp. Marseille-Q6965]|uniref:helix-turn-helix transcriptional regulator n=1 Tax=Microbacterium sp. Marseille-Q6965 TaxID=2965072 RepID=UPI0021B7320E|nr:WYL domain-containing protein [Microbacterium sp. Marseille-Q6965]
METTARMLTLLSLLQVPRDWPGRTLADRLGVTTRTVRRDVDRLRELGYRIHALKGPDGGYRLQAGAELPPLRFDDEQAVAIAIALRSAAATGVGIEEAAQRALATVQQVMPSHLRHRIDGVRFEDNAPPPSVAAEVLEAVSEAVRRGMTLRFDYGEADGPPRRTEPHGLVAQGGRWYLVAWDLDREDWRIFRLDCLAPRRPIGPAFASRPVPTGDPRSFVSARFKGATNADAWPCVGTVEIDLPARHVTPWIHDGEVEPIGPGSTRVRTGSWSWTGLLASILRFDAAFRIVGPEELIVAAQRMERRVREASLPASESR